MPITKESILSILSEIPDPEIPVITIRELGMLRGVLIIDDKAEVIITPTYSGCPATKQIEDDILSLLKKNGIENAKVKLEYHPAWTTDWITDEAKEKLRKYGIAPPENSSMDKGSLTGKQKACPLCGSINTEMISRFGSTPCKALYRCNECKEPFDYFKCH
jgi:ring-1,2-phenylacetyl-CoA epoxidase subunit PaaD